MASSKVIFTVPCPWANTGLGEIRLNSHAAQATTTPNQIDGQLLLILCFKGCLRFGE